MTATRQLEAAGGSVTTEEERLYEALIENPNSTVAALASVLRWRPETVLERLEALEAGGFATRSLSAPVRFGPVDPEIAFGTSLSEHQREIDRIRSRAAELSRRYRSVGAGEVPPDRIEIIRGSDNIDHRVRAMLLDAREEILGFDLPPYDDPATERPLTEHDARFEIDCLRAGISMRTIYDLSSLDFPGVLESAAFLAEYGEQAKVIAGLPMKLLIVDRRMAVTPLDPERPLSECLVIHAKPLVSSLVQLFERTWTAADHLVPGTSGDRGDAAALDELDLKILRLLALGLKNRALARQLGIGERTLERRTRQLLEELGAETRFQAGCIAARQGLV